MYVQQSTIMKENHKFSSVTRKNDFAIDGLGFLRYRSSMDEWDLYNRYEKSNKELKQFKDI